MAYNELTPSLDASQGLIYRLNILWMKTDYAVLEANYNKWDVLLDRIYANLLYRESMDIEKSLDGEIKSVELNDKDRRIYIFLSMQISIAKRKFFTSKNNEQKSYSRSIWYHACQKKDIWLRKLMYKHNLYLKEAKKSPGNAIFGDFGSKNRSR